MIKTAFLSRFPHFALGQETALVVTIFYSFILSFNFVWRLLCVCDSLLFGLESSRRRFKLNLFFNVIYYHWHEARFISALESLLCWWPVAVSARTKSFSFFGRCRNKPSLGNQFFEREFDFCCAKRLSVILACSSILRAGDVSSLDITAAVVHSPFWLSDYWGKNCFSVASAQVLLSSNFIHSNDSQCLNPFFARLCRSNAA